KEHAVRSPLVTPNKSTICSAVEAAGTGHLARMWDCSSHNRTILTARVRPGFQPATAPCESTPGLYKTSAGRNRLAPGGSELGARSIVSRAEDRPCAFLFTRRLDGVASPPAARS